MTGRQPVAEALRAGASLQKILMATGMKPSAITTEIQKRAEAANVPVRFVPRDELDRLTAGNHQGVGAVVGRYRYSDLRKVLGRDPRIVLFLDGITDPHNLGSLLRSAECAGSSGVVIPAHRAAGVTAAVRRVSAGAADLVPVARVPNLVQAIEEARRAGYWVVGLDASGSTDIWGSKLVEPPVVLVLGSEGKGLSRLVKESCDELVKIPQRGRVGSLNVGVAGALALFEVVRRVQGPSATL